MATNRAAEYTLTLTEEEREELLRLLEQADEDVRGEQRRTESPKYHEEVRQEEHLLARLVEKVRRLAR
jgi:hypothetical protein